MNKKNFVCIIVFWAIIKVAEYYILPFFIVPLSWIGIFIIFSILIIIQIIKIIKERRNITKSKIITLFTFLLIIYFTFTPWIIDGFIEKIDWILYYPLRNDIVEKVKLNKLNPNVSWNDLVCELPYEFPIVSNGGNDICIYRNSDNTLTVTFFISRTLFNAPSTYFVYTNSNRVVYDIEEYIKYDKNYNWKIKENWYRMHGKDVDVCFYGE
jgi:hypothetical protein